MQFAVALPWWGYALVFAAALFFAWLAYVRVGVELTGRQRALLTALRAAALLLIVIFLLRPVRFERAENPRDNVVPILVDVSRSMRLADTQGPSRMEQAQTLARELETRLNGEFRVQLFTFGEALARAQAGDFTASARRSDLSGALSALADRIRGEHIAGIVVLSDGGDTAGEEAGSARPLGSPVFTVGVGAGTGVHDREVVNLTAGEPLLADSSVDLSVSATSTGFATQPIELRMSANGRPMEVRRVTPGADGAPVHEVFTVSPDADNPTVYSVEIPVAPGELASENNVRSVLVPPKGRSRRVLVVEGAPGFEHTFLKRALAKDQGIEVDSVVRKGQNDQGRDTFFVQATSSRAAALAGGYPIQRSDLFAYDAIVFGNIEGEFFTQDQLEMTRDFVSTRGGGLIVLGARSFERSGLVGTALEEVLPLDLTDRRGGVARASLSAPIPATNAVALTDDGAGHPATRIAVSPADSRQKWAKLPALASTFAVGGPRPGAQVLAVTTGGGGELRPLLAAQRFGLGRSMVFAGEASWRWRMLMPAADNTHETIWRQMVRWLSAGAPDPITIAPPATTLPGTTETVGVLVRTAEFKPIADAEVTLRVTPPGGQERSLTAALSDPGEGRYTAAVRFDTPGVYRLAADVRREGGAIGRATRPALVGGADLEMSEPRLNEAVLSRIARASNGKYLSAGEASTLPDLLRAARDETGATEMKDLWNTGWSLLAVITILAIEWIVRRRVGLA
jgi:uncharacterized membrane protein